MTDTVEVAVSNRFMEPSRPPVKMQLPTSFPPEEVTRLKSGPDSIDWTHCWVMVEVSWIRRLPSQLVEARRESDVEGI